MKSNQTYFNQVKNIHDNYYTYDEDSYLMSLSKITICCPIHGKFRQRADSHLSGKGCKKCNNEKTQLPEEVIMCNLLKMNTDYEYVQIERKSNNIYIHIICQHHGHFKQRYDHHLNGHGCPKCSNNKKLTKEKFSEKSKLVHNNKYDYSLVEYINNHTKVKIICDIHGVFEQKPSNHLNGKGCSKCSNNKKITKEEFIEKAKLIHNNKYEYSLVEYINSKTKVKIICPIHGIFEQSPSNHTHIKLKQGCPLCNESKGEIEIKTILNNLNIKYIQEYKLYEKNKTHPLKADFFLPDFNIVIEYNGIQHYEPVKRFGGDKTFINIKNRDNRKKQLCKEKNIKLIVINYKSFSNIKDIIKSSL